MRGGEFVLKSGCGLPRFLCFVFCGGTCLGNGADLRLKFPDAFTELLCGFAGGKMLLRGLVNLVAQVLDLGLQLLVRLVQLVRLRSQFSVLPGALFGGAGDTFGFFLQLTQLGVQALPRFRGIVKGLLQIGQFGRQPRGILLGGGAVEFFLLQTRLQGCRRTCERFLFLLESPDAAFVILQLLA